MATSPEYTQYILEQLSQIEPIQHKKMFGGVGLFIEEGMFALISSEDVLYFKADDQNRSDYEATGMAQFHSMPYFQLPVDVLESPQELALWMENSMSATKRANKGKKKK